jgi:hypothetical protein
LQLCRPAAVAVRAFLLGEISDKTISVYMLIGLMHEVTSASAQLMFDP